MNKQLMLNGEVNNNTTNLGVFTLSKRRVLELFYLDFSDIGLSLVELNRKLLIEMSENTIARGLQYLFALGYITIKLRNMGPTHRRKYYKITEVGAMQYERMR